MAIFGDAILRGANLERAILVGTHFGGADLSGANLSGAELTGAHFSNSTLDKARFSNAELAETLFSAVDLSSLVGLETCVHNGPSILDYRTLQMTGPLPLVFLRGVGLPDSFIDYLPSLLNQPVQMYSCFISYSSKDREFTERLHADLQSKGVRCWFAPHDLPIGAKTLDALDQAIRLRDKLLLILSKNALASNWVEDEVNKAFAEERDRRQLVLFPIRIDNSVMQAPEPWARKLRDQRNIGDFRKWKDNNTYQASLNRLIRDLAVKKP
jgi:hypothetical protein